MGLLGWVVGAGVAGTIIKGVAYYNSEEAKQERRRNTPCDFVDGISEEEFAMLVCKEKQRIKRLSEITVNGPVIYGTVQSQSGISEWGFKLDFNDYGHITGRYWMSSDNEDSKIPERVGNLISEAVQNYLSD